MKPLHSPFEWLNQPQGLDSPLRDNPDLCLDLKYGTVKGTAHLMSLTI